MCGQPSCFQRRNHPATMPGPAHQKQPDRLQVDCFSFAMLVFELFTRQVSSATLSPQTFSPDACERHAGKVCCAACRSELHAGKVCCAACRSELHAESGSLAGLLLPACACLASPESLAGNSLHLLLAGCQPGSRATLL